MRFGIFSKLLRKEGADDACQQRWMDFVDVWLDQVSGLVDPSCLEEHQVCSLTRVDLETRI